MVFTVVLMNGTVKKKTNTVQLSRCFPESANGIKRVQLSSLPSLDASNPASRCQPPLIGGSQAPKNFEVLSSCDEESTTPATFHFAIANSADKIAVLIHTPDTLNH